MEKKKQKLIPKGLNGLLTTPFTYSEFILSLDPKTQEIIENKELIDNYLSQDQTHQLYQKDKPLSPNDPVGEFYVGTAAGKILEYPIKLIGKAGLYGLGRLGNNWARAKLISGDLNSAPLKYFGTIKYYGPTMGKTTAAKTNPDVVDFDSYARQTTKKLAKKHGLTKQLLQISPRLEQEYKNMLLNLVEQWRTDPNNAFKTLVVSKKVLANEPIYSNIPSIPDRATFLERLALRGEKFPFRADDYYDALRSANPNLLINNNFVSDLEYNPHYISVELLPTIIGENIPKKIVQLKTATPQITSPNDAMNGWKGNRYVLDLTTLEGILNFINNDIIPRMLAQGHNVSSYIPTFRQFSPKTDAFDEAMNKTSSAGAWFTPASNDITIIGPLEKQDFGLTIHEAGGHGLRYNMLSDYIPTKREYLNEYILTGGKDMSDEAINALLKMHTGDQIYNTIEAQKLRDSYPWIKTYFEKKPVQKSGDTVLRESGSVNTQFRSHYSNNGKIVGKELDKVIDKASSGVVLRDLIEQPYTSSIIYDIAKITGKDPGDLLFYGPEMLEKLVDNYSKLLEIVSKVKDTMKTVGSYGVPITVGGSTASTLIYDNYKQKQNDVPRNNN